MNKKVILAYSGGLDTSCSIKWLQEFYGYDVIAVTMDLGEDKELQSIQEKALKIGASKCYILPLQESLANDFLIPALQANALYEGIYPLISALSRPLIAESLVNIAKKENAIAAWRELMGATNPEQAAPGTIRKLYAKDIGQNAVHGSDSKANAAIELALFFPDL